MINFQRQRAGSYSATKTITNNDKYFISIHREGKKWHVRIVEFYSWETVTAYKCEVHSLKTAKAAVVNYMNSLEDLINPLPNNVIQLRRA